ncbi:hypothetical protein EDB92DRAFT_1820125 [Lactarius akahatsu]|uniref:Uncharacterized protein n=1 Tax=Lactarius akahatsu TaxID=416441 RepID=A0AAD4Q8V0_9AGAM|nr:hypothetical protein EDB92DRAFT_1820125 [Lactarius akahatsu]
MIPRLKRIRDINITLSAAFGDTEQDPRSDVAPPNDIFTWDSTSDVWHCMALATTGYFFFRGEIRTGDGSKKEKGTGPKSCHIDTEAPSSSLLRVTEATTEFEWHDGAGPRVHPQQRQRRPTTPSVLFRQNMQLQRGTARVTGHGWQGPGPEAPYNLQTRRELPTCKNWPELRRLPQTYQTWPRACGVHRVLPYTHTARRYDLLKEITRKAQQGNDKRGADVEQLNMFRIFRECLYGTNQELGSKFLDSRRGFFHYYEGATWYFPKHLPQRVRLSP